MGGQLGETGIVFKYIKLLTGWLEPLLSRIHEDKRHVVTPVIESILDDTLRFDFTKHKDIQVGRFDWNMVFNWMPVAESVKKKLINKATPIRFVLAVAYSTFSYVVFVTRHIFSKFLPINRVFAHI